MIILEKRLSSEADSCFSSNKNRISTLIDPVNLNEFSCGDYLHDAFMRMFSKINTKNAFKFNNRGFQSNLAKQPVKSKTTLEH